MKQTKIHIRDADLTNADAALKRAGVRARKLAEQTNTPLVVYEGGRVTRKKVVRAKAK